MNLPNEQMKQESAMKGSRLIIKPGKNRVRIEAIYPARAYRVVGTVELVKGKVDSMRVNSYAEIGDGDRKLVSSQKGHKAFESLLALGQSIFPHWMLK